MVRKTICYANSLIYVFFFILFIKSKLDYNFFEKYFFIICLFFAINFFISIICILLFGLPSNNYKEYLFKYISYKEITEFNGSNINIILKNKKWHINYKGRKYIFDMRGWINQKQRVIDFLFIQFHNNYYNSKKLTLLEYPKNYFKKLNIKIKFQIGSKIITKKFKPSILLRLKLILAIQQNPRAIDKSQEYVRRDLFSTFLTLH